MPMLIKLRWPLPTTARAAAGAVEVPVPLVLDTNIVLDCLVFNDPATAPLQALLQTGALRWVATRPMRDELERVLGYPQIAPRVAFHGLSTASVLETYDGQVQWAEVPKRTAAVCKDADDQKFIDLAAAQCALLLSKDKAVLRMRKRLLVSGVHIASTLVFG